jgi:hypothetical protein
MCCCGLQLIFHSSRFGQLWWSFHLSLASSHCMACCHACSWKSTFWFVNPFNPHVHNILVHASAKYRIRSVLSLLPRCLAAAQLLVGTHVLIVPSLQWPCPSITACFISLHTPLRNFVAIGFKIKEISFFLCLLSLLPRSRGAASLTRAFPKIRYSVCQILLPTCASWTCTYFHKLVCP